AFGTASIDGASLGQCALLIKQQESPDPVVELANGLEAGRGQFFGSDLAALQGTEKIAGQALIRHRIAQGKEASIENGGNAEGVLLPPRSIGQRLVGLQGGRR